MTENEKELLWKDLCARLPYGVEVEYDNCTCEVRSINKFNDELTILKFPGYSEIDVKIEDVKPYLFPLSSMTEEQKQEYTYIVNYISSDDTENWKEGEFIYVEQFTQLMHFYHINHLDYMGLIPMGLSNDATGLNIY